MEYISFNLNGKTVGIKNSKEYLLNQTHINKMFSDEHGEYINYKGDRIEVYDTSLIFDGVCFKKFDGMLFVKYETKTIAFKTEGFFKTRLKVDLEIDPSEFI